MKQHIKWSVHNTIGVLAISNKPENYLEYPDFVDLEQLKKWTGKYPLKGLVIHGDGRHFSAGGKLENIKELLKNEALKETIKKGKAILNHIEQLNIPVIAAISGTCFGGGLEIALACHIRVCTNNALFALPETNHNLAPGLGGTIRLPHLVGTGNALKIIMKGDLINAEEALKIKLVDHVTPTKDVVKYAIDFVEKMTANKTYSVIHAVTESVRNANVLSHDESMEMETKLFCKLAMKKYNT